MCFRDGLFRRSAPALAFLHANCTTAAELARRKPGRHAVPKGDTKPRMRSSPRRLGRPELGVVGALGVENDLAAAGGRGDWPARTLAAVDHRHAGWAVDDTSDE